MPWVRERREGDLVFDGLNVCREARCVILQALGWRVYLRLRKGRLPVLSIYRYAS